MNEQTPIARVSKSVRVKAPIERAFEVFTGRSDALVAAESGVGEKPIAKVWMEPSLGGRWIEKSESGKETLVATIIELAAAPSPGAAVADRCRVEAGSRNEVRGRCALHRRGPDATLVELVHHKFETMGIAGGAKMRKDVDGGWPGMLEKFAAAAERAI